MAYEWQTVEQAAVTLGISARTLARRIAKGDIENRLHNGRREVFICLPDEAEASPPAPPEERATIIDPSGTAIGAVNAAANAATPQTSTVDVNMTHALILAEDRARRAEIAISVIKQSTQLVQFEVARARAGARWAWATVAMLGVGGMVAVAWTTAQVTNSRIRTEHLQERMLTATQQSEKLVRDNESLRERNELALQAVAKATGSMEEVHREIAHTRGELQQLRDRKPTTQPNSLAKRLATAVLGD